MLLERVAAFPGCVVGRAESLLAVDMDYLATTEVRERADLLGAASRSSSI